MDSVSHRVMSAFVWAITARNSGREVVPFPVFRRSSAEVRRADVSSDMVGSKEERGRKREYV